jgi:hypothetical protein
MKKYMTRIITVLLAFSLTSFSLKAADTNSVPKPQPKFVLCALAVAAAAGFVVYSIYRCVQTAGLASPPPPPPNNGTNSSSPNIVFAPHDLTPPGPTNGVSGTNSSTLVVVPSVLKFDVVLATNNDPNVELKQDVSTNGWVDWQGNTYTWFFTTQTDPSGPHVQTSTNLVAWTDASNTVNMWFSSSASPDPDMLYFTNMVVVFYDGNGIPLLTNWSAVTPNVPVNAGVPATEPQMYFRGVTP